MTTDNSMVVSLTTAPLAMNSHELQLETAQRKEQLR